MTNDESYTVGSDNIFADAGLPNPEECLARVQLLKYIIAEIKRRGLSQRQAAKLLEVPQPHICLLLQARVSNFSLERLLQMVARLGVNVAILCRPATGEQGHVTLSLLQST
jgi:predicted XRE-type DNA-binding protein